MAFTSEASMEVNSTLTENYDVLFANVSEKIRFSNILKELNYL